MTVLCTDNSKNISKVEDELSVLHQPCVVHTVNLIVQKVINRNYDDYRGKDKKKNTNVPMIIGLIYRVCKIVSFFHKSTKAKNILRD